MTDKITGFLFRTLSTLALYIALMPVSLPVLAGASPWVNSDFSQIRLVAVSGSGGLVAGLHIRLEPGWKTYWRTPGDSGVPTIVDWSASKNISVTGLRWPLPKRDIQAGYQSFVYENEVVLPLKVGKSVNSDPVVLSANVDYAVCKEICVPLNAELKLETTPGVPARGDKVHKRLLDRFLAHIPSSGKNAGLQVVSSDLVTSGQEQTLTVTVAAKKALIKPEMFLEAPQPFTFSVPNKKLAADGKSARFAFRVNGGIKKLSITGKQVVITAGSGDRAVETTIVAR